ncbi:hypothetical protein AB6A40_007201 [Gnathostoma spinigerum]|uniref:IgGFc-binding protein N-terminal domain-containing protein n=1 Tax=Gnathostoma spinigerum TaxID=75299 RepID=A0ABD6EUX6_9BILA
MIRIRSTAPVQVLAHSYTKDGAGDTYAVLPITMASTSYSFSLPSTADGGLSMVYFLPAGSDAEISVKLKTKDSQQTMNFDIKKDDSSDMMMLGGPNKPFTVYAKGSAPFVVLIASKQVSVGGKYRDFMCTMPMSDAWKSKPKKDNTPQHYLADVSTSAYFYVTPPEDVKQIDVHGSNGESKQISAKDLGHKMRSFADENLGTHVDIVGKSLQVERIGDPHSNGVFLDMIPAYNQWLTGPAAFRPRHKGDQLLIFGENVTAKSCELAFKPAQSPPSWKQIKGIFGGSVFATSVKTLNADPLIITSACPYVALVVGTRDHHAYAYTPAMNLPNSRAPPPPAPKTTTIPSTSTTTSTTTTSPTTSSTTSTTSPDTVPTKATAGSTARTFATTAGASNCAPVIALTLFSIVDAIIR